MGNTNKPYISLGNHLKFVREQANQSLAEVSGAVEIDEADLARIEAGFERPDEEVLLLLINHFKVQDREAVQLWELANYDSDMPDEIGYTNQSTATKQQAIMLLAMDMRTIYSDGLDIVANPAGLTLNFTQSTGPNQATPVSRIGISLEQAERIVKAMQNSIMGVKYGPSNKQLPPPSKPL